MSIETELIAHLAADATLAALVSDRIHAVLMPQGGDFPAVTITRIASEEQLTMEPLAGHVLARFQLDAWAETGLEAIAVGDAIRGALQGHAQAALDGGGTLAVQGIRLVEPGIRDGYEPESELCRRSLDFEVVYLEPLP